jgi:hypothetical protein
MSWASYSVEDRSVGSPNVVRRHHNSLIFKYPCETPKCTNYKVTFSPGKYLFECYGSGQLIGTAGAYTSGVLDIDTTTTLYFYIGMRPLYQKLEYDEVFNSGFGKILASYSGGASTDIRLINGRWESFESLKSRIMVAAGSGAYECCPGGSGGDLEGIDGKGCSNEKCSKATYDKYGVGAKQNQTVQSGRFGISYNLTNSLNANQGGNGYYSGGSSGDAGAGSGGGSSFISGHKGCDAINEESTEYNIIHSGSPYHYSNVFFYNTVIKNGDEKFLDPKGKAVIGNVGNGIVVVTKLYFRYSCRIQTKQSHSVPFVIIILLTN